MSVDANVVSLFGREAPVVVNAAGGMQSKTAGAFYMLPAKAIRRLRYTPVSKQRTYLGHIASAWDHLTALLADDEGPDHLGLAFAHLALALEVADGDRSAMISTDSLGTFPAGGLVRIAQVMEEGAARYARGNWRLIEFSSHVNHALQHVTALEMGDESDDHLGHAITRLAFAIETEDPRNPYRFTAIETPKARALVDAAELVAAETGSPMLAIVTNEAQLARELSGLDDAQWSALIRGIAKEFERRDTSLLLEETSFIVFGAATSIVPERVLERDSD